MATFMATRSTSASKRFFFGETIPGRRELGVMVIESAAHEVEPFGEGVGQLRAMLLDKSRTDMVPGVSRGLVFQCAREGCQRGPTGCIVTRPAQEKHVFDGALLHRTILELGETDQPILTQ